jgi:hypothetical protein
MVSEIWSREMPAAVVTSGVVIRSGCSVLTNWRLERFTNTLVREPAPPVGLEPTTRCLEVSTVVALC